MIYLKFQHLKTINYISYLFNDILKSVTVGCQHTVRASLHLHLTKCQVKVICCGNNSNAQQHRGQHKQHKIKIKKVL